MDKLSKFLDHVASIWDIFLGFASLFIICIVFIAIVCFGWYFIFFGRF